MKSIQHACSIVCFSIGVMLFGNSVCSAQTTCAGAMDLCRAVVPDVATLRAATTSPGPYITITCYYNGTTPTNICAGGGDFDRGPPCVSNDNGVTLLKDGVSPQKNCYYRKNFGLNGVVDARQCGVVGTAGAIGDLAALNNCMSVAAANGIYKTFTGGGVILDPGTAGNITPPAGMTLTCGGNNQGLNVDNDYRIGSSLANAIVLDLHDTISLSNQNTVIEGCNILAGTTNAGTSTNPYSPSVWYPKCPPAATPCGTPLASASLRSSLQEIDAFNPNPTATYPTSPYGPAGSSVGITLTGEHPVVHNVTVLGFGTCFKTDGAKRFEFQNLIGNQCCARPERQSSHARKCIVSEDLAIF